MSPVAYPWRWLADSVGTVFVVRFPWLDALRAASGTGEKVCLLVPEAAGPLAGWSEWLLEWTGQDQGVPPLVAAGDFREVARTLATAYALEEDGPGAEGAADRPADWSRAFVAACRRRMPHVETVPVIVPEADDGCAAGLGELVAAQRAMGYSLVRPVLLRRTVPPAWGSEVVRFGLPQPVGDLHRLEPPPERDQAFWTGLLLALTVCWEAGAVPRLADELWEQLRLSRVLSLRDPGFDLWLQEQLRKFAGRTVGETLPSLPEVLAYAPQTAVTDGLWQRGAVAWQDGLFDVTPLWARLWGEGLADDAREAVRRRRLTNVPLARWLSAWAASIEESLRVAALQAGGRSFRLFLQSRPPRSRREDRAASRWEELDAEDDVAAIDQADFSDLAAFVARSRSAAKRPLPPTALLEECRLARNRVVHERRVWIRDLLDISRAVSWLADEGLI